MDDKVESRMPLGLNVAKPKPPGARCHAISELNMSSILILKSYWH